MRSLLDAEDYKTLPEEPLQRFIELEALCRSRLLKNIENEGQYFDSYSRLYYITTISTAAEELGIGGIHHPSDERLSDIESALRDFFVSVTKATTQINLQQNISSDPYSVRLTARTRGRIELELNKLREAIEDGNWTDSERKDLHKILDEFLEETRNPRARFGKMLALIAALSLGGISAVADAPQAISNITRHIGADKLAEDKERERLGPPATARALPKPNNEKKERYGGGYNRDLDDEIPF